MTSKNDITGDDIKSKATSDAFRDGYDRIFGKQQTPQSVTLTQEQQNAVDDTAGLEKK